MPQEIKKHEDYKNKVGNFRSTKQEQNIFSLSKEFNKIVFHLNTIITLAIINKVRLKIIQGISSLSLAILLVSILTIQTNKRRL
jgi:hypothetical protein